MSQYEVVLKHLKDGKELSQLEATEKYGILRLGAIICKMRKQGYEISTKTVRKPNRYGHVSNYGVYKLLKEN
jgi:hypothetical protein